MSEEKKILFPNLQGILRTEIDYCNEIIKKEPVSDIERDYLTPFTKFHKDQAEGRYKSTNKKVYTRIHLFSQNYSGEPVEYFTLFADCTVTSEEKQWKSLEQFGDLHRVGKYYSYTPYDNGKPSVILNEKEAVKLFGKLIKNRSMKEIHIEVSEEAFKKLYNEKHDSPRHVRDYKI